MKRKLQHLIKELKSVLLHNKDLIHIVGSLQTEGHKEHLRKVGVLKTYKRESQLINLGIVNGWKKPVGNVKHKSGQANERL